MNQEMSLISRAGKTFYFSTRWLAKSSRLDTAVVYNFCRLVDDIADSNPTAPDRDSRLRAVATAVACKDAYHPLVAPLLPLITRYPNIEEPLVALVEACRNDVPSLHIRDEEDLIRYSHGVAGNVGLIMYPILGGLEPEGLSYAADLGIAMQCTNIARDVLEDSARGRIYLPSSWFKGNSSVDEILERPTTDGSVVQAVQQLLLLADTRYERGLSGLKYLAPHNRFAVRVAATCYRAIGGRVIRNGQLARQRAVVPLAQKILLACALRLSPRRLFSSYGSSTR